MSKENFGSVLVLGSSGMVGSSIGRLLKERGCENVHLINRDVVDLTDSDATRECFSNFKVDWVVISAAKVGGIFANDAYPVQFLTENLKIQTNALESAYESGIRKGIFLGSSCIYPKFCPQPITEDALLTGALEPTNEAYALAKITGIKLCESFNRQYGTDFRSLMPTNLFGPGDNYHPENSHVIPALIRRFHEAKMNHTPSVEVWGSGKVRREFLYVDDLAKICAAIMQIDKKSFYESLSSRCSHINVGTGQDLPIATLAEKVANVVGYDGAISFDVTKPEGTPRKVLDITKLKKLVGSSVLAFTNLEVGLKHAYQDFLSKY